MALKMSLIKEFTKGLIKENPVLVLVLGMCPTLAVTTSAINGIAMGLAVAFVLAMSNLVISILRHSIPSKVRIPCYIVVIASFVTVVDLVMHGYLYDLHKALGLFIPLIVVNCIILGRAEAFASKKSVLASLLDGLGMGFGFTLTLFILGATREILGNGTILDGTPWAINLMGQSYEPILVMILPPGAFISLGIMVGLKNRFLS
jgi:electron transport complex protein RnfE